MFISSKKSQGFSLLEMSIVIVIIGIVLSATSTVLPTLIRTAKAKKTEAMLDRYESALKGYFIANGHFPCPDGNNDGLEDRDKGVNTGDDEPGDDSCTNGYVGNLPYLTLMLSTGNDAVNQPVKYGVYEDLIKTVITATATSPAACTRLQTIISANTLDSNKIYTAKTTSPTNPINRPYILASGGAKNLNGAGDGFFDGQNEGSDALFDTPERLEFHAAGGPSTNDYDDLVRAASFPSFSGEVCASLSGGGGGVPIALSEQMYSGGCSNGADDDNDNKTDCEDPDCKGDSYCVETVLKITTSSIPTAKMNSIYSATLAATGGTPNYTWTLNPGGITGIKMLDAYSPQITGTINVCKGNYTVTVDVYDSATPTPLHDTKSFPLTVTSDLAIVRTSGDNMAPITWSTASQIETFTTSGPHLGNITWTLDAVGANNFTLTSTGAETCSIKKKSGAAAGTYSLTLTARDSNPTCASNTATKTISVTVQAAGVGTAGAITTDGLGAYQFATYAREPSLLSDDYFGVASFFLAYQSAATPTGRIQGIYISTDGTYMDDAGLTALSIASTVEMELMWPAGDYPWAFAMIHRNTATNNMGLTTVTINDAWTSLINKKTLSSSHLGFAPAPVQIGPNAFAIISSTAAASGDGFVKTVGLSSDGASISYAAPFSQADFPTNFPTKLWGGATTDLTDIATNTYRPNIVKVEGSTDIYAAVYGKTGILTTIKIPPTGALPSPTSDHPYYPIIDSMQFGDYVTNWDTGAFIRVTGYEPKILHVTGDIYAIVYRGNDGWISTTDDQACTLITIEIDKEGKIIASRGGYGISSWGCFEPDMVKVANNVIAVAYAERYVDPPGWGTAKDNFVGLDTYEIGTNGSISYITSTILDESATATNTIWLPKIAHYYNDIFAIAYSRTNSYNGWIRAVKIKR